MEGNSKRMKTQKTPEMEEFLEQAAQGLFGRGRNEGVCVTCGSSEVKTEDFRDDLSRREYELSRMCQKCQDEVFQLIPRGQEDNHE